MVLKFGSYGADIAKQQLMLMIRRSCDAPAVLHRDHASHCWEVLVHEPQCNRQSLADIADGWHWNLSECGLRFRLKISSAFRQVGTVSRRELIAQVRFVRPQHC